MKGTPMTDDDAEAAILEEIDNRDKATEWADRLADVISRITGTDVGEHSSTNDPWQNAVDAGFGYIERRNRRRDWQVHPDAPVIWTDEQVTSVADFQVSGAFHPYTCGGGGGGCSGVSLLATPAGLRCPSCGRLQTTGVHSSAIDGDWRGPAAAMMQKLREISRLGGKS